MPRFYCDYCDAYLTHDSPYGRQQHNRGWKHRDAFKAYYQKLYPQWLAESQQKHLEMMQNIQMGQVIGSINMMGAPPQQMMMGAPPPFPGQPPFPMPMMNQPGMPNMMGAPPPMHFPRPPPMMGQPPNMPPGMPPQNMPSSNQQQQQQS